MPLEQMNSSSEAKPGIYRFDEILRYAKGKRVGVVVNHTSLIEKTHLVDTALSSGIFVQTIFAPEHGFRGSEDAGKHIASAIDSLTGIQLISLYGKSHKPTKQDLTGIELIIFDLQDVGTRFYTYISTLHYVMEACAENNIKLLILDRLNPNGHFIDGPVLDSTFRSFVGLHPIPVVYGMTLAELANMIKGECWINACKQLDMSYILCKNYDRNKIVNIEIPPSPNLRTLRSILLYPGLCFFEGTRVSVGRGTDFPFLVYGHPELKSDFSFTPVPKKGAMHPPLENVLCYGHDLRGISINKLHGMKKIDLSHLLSAFKDFKGKDTFFLKTNFIDKLAGTDQLRRLILAGKSENEIRKSWIAGLESFKRKRTQYLLYPDFN